MTKRDPISKLLKELLSNSEESLRNFKIAQKKERECSREGHPYEHRDIGYYHPGCRYIETVCTNCEAVLERLPTAREIEESRIDWDAEFNLSLQSSY